MLFSTIKATLDPFGSRPGSGSRVAGLGGPRPLSAADAIFHTAFTSFDPGPLVVDVVFTGLAATTGTMLIHATARPDHGAEPTDQSAELVNLAELAATGGHHRLAVMIRPGHAYAIAGRLVDDRTDARATGLTVSAAGRAEGARFAGRLAAARRALTPDRGLLTGLVEDAPATLARARSQMCTAAQFDEPAYDEWLRLAHRHKHRHRKQWEYVWICRVLDQLGCLQDGARGLGFGCGIEPLPAIFAARGVHVTATDLGAEDDRARRWQRTDQHLLSAAALNDPAICPPDRFFRLVTTMAVDMNAVPATLTDYDFCWSSCSLEHLGTIDAGLHFLVRSLDTLRPGGVAVHTTELNLSSDRRTIRRGGTVLFRRSDLIALARRLTDAGHEVLPITWDQGDQPEDQIVDVAPYAADQHLKLALRSFVTTSFGLAVRKRPAAC